MNPCIRDRARSEGGYSLIETILAMAIMGFVILSVATLFFFGRRNVYSGKQMTQAISIGTRVMEDISSINKRAIYNGAFNIADNATGTSIVVNGVTYANSKIRSTKSNVMTSPPADISTELTGSTTPTGPSLLTKWNTQVGSTLQDGSVTMILTPVEDPTNTPAQFQTATIMRVRVIVQWREARRLRNITLDSVKPF
ncbi:MAG: prepilin-type N-terminal cleavage/methylation domain-containing protein [Acidobacteriota bacterium]